MQIKKIMNGLLNRHGVIQQAMLDQKGGNLLVDAGHGAGSTNQIRHIADFWPSSLDSGGSASEWSGTAGGEL
jgi:hypothetical protein